MGNGVRCQEDVEQIPSQDEMMAPGSHIQLLQLLNTEQLGAKPCCQADLTLIVGLNKMLARRLVSY